MHKSINRSLNFCAVFVGALALLSAGNPSRAAAAIYPDAVTMHVTGLGSDTVDSVIERGDSAAEIFAKSACTDPVFPLVCVKVGDSSTLGIKLTCKNAAGKIVSCGKVTWKSKPSYDELTTAFKPDPGNPTTETVTASKTAKPGKYTQLISFVCTYSTSCKGSATADITVLK